jgi:hypothetical protein
VLVQRHLALDRTWSAPDSIVTRIELMNREASGGRPGLPLAWGSADALLVFLRRLPLLGNLLPAPQRLHWGEVATYRVRVQAIPGSSCGSGACFEAVLLDAAPDSS